MAARVRVKWQDQEFILDKEVANAIDQIIEAAAGSSGTAQSRISVAVATVETSAQGSVERSPDVGHQPWLLRITEVSERIGISVETLRYWRKHQKGPKAARVGNHLIYRAADVETWVNAQFDAL